MPIVISLCLWILAICLVQLHSSEKIQAAKDSGDMQDFFNEIESAMNKLIGVDAKSQKIRQADPRKQRYSHGKMTEYGHFSNNPAADYSKAIFSADDNRKKNDRFEFEGYQDSVFRPLHPCDHFDAVRRRCVLFRQQGTTLTLGVKLKDPPGPGTRIRWYRYLKKQQFDHYIRETLNKDFLPWNLNLGGSQNELRISPLTETDLSYNYFVAELDNSRTYHERYERRPTIRFLVEPIHIDMGSLYHGEEIIIYARSFMELPRKSVSFLWSLYDLADLEDHGLPSNMRLNGEGSSVIIKELKTFQSQILTCSVYSNKDVFLARRNFLFRGSANEDDATILNKSSTRRHKRSSGGTEELYYAPVQEWPVDTERSPNNLDADNPQSTEFLSGIQSLFRLVKVPDISKDLFYAAEKYELSPEDRPSNRQTRPERAPPFAYRDLDQFAPQDAFGYRNRADSRLNPRPDQAMEDDVLVREQPQTAPLRFEDKESQTIATCSSNPDCNVHADCMRASFSGQRFCKCSHGYKGNGIFCFSN